MDHDFYRNRYLKAQLKFVWFPKTCNISKTRLWLQFAYKLTAVWNGPGNYVFEERWHDKNTHIIWMLKR